MKFFHSGVRKMQRRQLPQTPATAGPGRGTVDLTATYASCRRYTRLIGMDTDLVPMFFPRLSFYFWRRSKGMTSSSYGLCAGDRVSHRPVGGPRGALPLREGGGAGHHARQHTNQSQGPSLPQTVPFESSFSFL
jgi:hypothetical protein